MADSHKEQQTTAEIMRERGEEITIPILKECFRKVDTNGDNLISFREFCLAIEELGIQWELDTAKTAFKTMDENGNKSLDWYEFSHGIHLVNPSVKAFWNNIFNPNEQEEEEEKTSFTVDEMEEILADRKSKWQVRNNVLIFLQKYAETLSDEEFHSMMEKIIESMSFQVQTRQSAVAREACLTVANLCKNRSEAMRRYLPVLMPGIWGALRMKINVINEAGKHAGRAAVRFVPDDDEHTVLNVLTEGSKERHKAVRARCFEYLSVLLEQDWTQKRLDEDEKYWEKFKALLIKGTGDKDAEARKGAFESILAFKTLGMDERFSEIQDQLSPRGKNALKRAEKALKKKS